MRTNYLPLKVAYTVAWVALTYALILVGFVAHTRRASGRDPLDE